MTSSEVYRPWFGLVEAVGVLAVLLVWYVVRDAGERVRAAAAAAGGLLLAVGVIALVSRLRGLGFTLGQIGADRPTPRLVADIVLGVGGVAAGVLAVRWLRDGAYLTDGEMEEGAEDPEADVSLRASGWLEPFAVALALALPIGLLFGPTQAYYDDYRGDVTALVFVMHVLVGVTATGALLAVVRPDPDADVRLVFGLFALLAAGNVVEAMWPGTLNNEFWVFLAVGVAVGLLAVTAPPFLARAFGVERTALAVGVLAALTLLAARAVVEGWSVRDQFHGRGFVGRFGPIDVPDVPEPSFVVPSMPVPTFPTFPPLPTFP